MAANDTNAAAFNVFVALGINPIKGYDMTQVADAVTARVRDLNRRINYINAAQKTELAEFKKVDTAIKSGQGHALLATHARAYATMMQAERTRQANEVKRDGAFYAPGGKIDPQVLHDLDEKYDMLSDADILTILGVQQDTATPPPIDADDGVQPLDTAMWTRITQHLSTTGHKDLYDVLGLRDNAAAGTIQAAHQRLYTEWSPRVNNDRKVAMVDLLGFCRTLLLDPSQRRRYDKSLLLQRFAGVSEKIERLGLGSNKVILAEQNDILLDECRRAGIDAGKAQTMISAAAARHGLVVIKSQPQPQPQPQPKQQYKQRQRRQQQPQPQPQPWQQPQPQPWQQPQPNQQQPQPNQFNGSRPDNHRTTCWLLLGASLFCLAVLAVPTAAIGLYYSYQTDSYINKGFPALAQKYSDRTAKMNSYTLLIIIGFWTAVFGLGGS